MPCVAAKKRVHALITVCCGHNKTAAGPSGERPWHVGYSLLITEVCADILRRERGFVRHEEEQSSGYLLSFYYLQYRKSCAVGTTLKIMHNVTIDADTSEVHSEGLTLLHY